MRKPSILETQAVSGKKRKGFSKIGKVLYLLGSRIVQFTFLVIVLVAISVLFLSLYQYMLRSPYIKLEQVVVTGADGELKNDLLKKLRLNDDQSLLAIDLGELKQLLEKDPWIRSVQLEKQFPHTLIIRVQKESPWALVALDKLSYINRWGEVFKAVDETDDVDYPVITGIPTRGIERERNLKLALQALRVLQSRMGPWSMEKLSEIHVDRRGTLFVYSVSINAVIRFRGNELDNKKDELKKIIEHLNRTGRIHMVKSIDLNFRDGTVVSFKKG